MLSRFMLRAGVAMATVILGGLVSAMLVRYSPGFGSDERQLDARLSSESRAAIRQEAEPERAVVRYYLRSAMAMLRGDLGVSRSLQRPVKELLAERAWVTASLIAQGLCLTWIVAILFAAASWGLGLHVIDRLGGVSSELLLCLPAGGIALLLVFLDWPAFLAIAVIIFPKTYSLLSSILREASRMPHILTAKAKGAGRLRVLLCHMMVVTRGELLALVGVSISLAVGAAIPVEVFTGTPGVGQLAWQAAMARDLPVMITVSMAVISVTVLANAGATMAAEPKRIGA